MKSYKEVCDTWFGGEENVIIIEETPMVKLVLGIEKDSISIALIMHVFDNYQISIDKRLDISFNSKYGSKLYISDIQRELYKIMFNLEYYLKYRDMEKQIAVGSVNDFISNIDKKCDINDLEHFLRSIVKNYCY